jgi:hypothetical protein
MTEHYKKHLIIGGMPEYVQSWATNADPEELTDIQKERIAFYKNDITKHSGKVNSGKFLQ